MIGSFARPNRRQALLLPASAIGATRAWANGLRAAAIDWAMFETALALGTIPVAATELRQFRQIAVEPTFPESVVDLGLRGTPNFELLRIVAPDLILISNFYEYQRASLERIAPVMSFSLYQPGIPPYATAEEATIAVGARLSRVEAAARLVAEGRAEIEALAGALAGKVGSPVFVISLGDARHFRAFGADSMFGDVLGRLGIANAWTDRTSYSATAPISLEALATVPDAFIAVVGPVPPDVFGGLQRNALWQALPAVREERVVFLSPVNHFGALPAARRFARLLAQSLLDPTALSHG